MERLVGKEGTCQLTRNWHMPQTSQSPLYDFFSDCCRSVLYVKWHWWLLILMSIFPILWACFAVLYYGMAKLHGDLDDVRNPNVSRCVENFGSFTAAFLFSVETQERIGYGYRFSNEDCVGILAQISIQATLGRMVVLIMGISFFARFNRAESCSNFLIFSKTAVITQNEENGARCFMVRVGDVDGRQLNGMSYRLYFADKNNHPETLIPMTVEDNGDLFLLPTLVRHEIDHNSPLFSLRQRDLLQDNFEVIVVVEGLVESNGITVHCRTSYLSSEIQWGYSFDPLPLFNSPNDKDTIKIQYKTFDKTSMIFMSDQSVKNVIKNIPYQHRNHYYD